MINGRTETFVSFMNRRETSRWVTAFHDRLSTRYTMHRIRLEAIVGFVRILGPVSVRISRRAATHDDTTGILHVYLSFGWSHYTLPDASVAALGNRRRAALLGSTRLRRNQP